MGVTSTQLLDKLIAVTPTIKPSFAVSISQLFKEIKNSTHYFPRCCVESPYFTPVPLRLFLRTATLLCSNDSDVRQIAVLFAALLQ